MRKSERAWGAMMVVVLGGAGCGPVTIDPENQPSATGGSSSSTAGTGSLHGEGGDGLDPVPPEGTGGGNSSTGCAEVAHRWIVFDSGSLTRLTYAIRVDGFDVRGLGVGTEPAVSPDGNYLAYVSYDRVMLQRTGTHDVRELVFGDQPAWSEDSTKVAFHQGNSVQIHDVAAGTSRTLVSCDTCFFGGYQHPEFVHGDTAVVVDRENQINSVNLATGAERYLVNNWTVDMAHPSVSRDGIWAAVVLNGDGGYGLWLSRYDQAIDPGRGRRLTPVSEQARSPSWGPGRWIAYESGDDGVEHDIVVLNVQTGERCRVTGSGDDSNPRWAPEGFEPP